MWLVLDSEIYLYSLTFITFTGYIDEKTEAQRFLTLP